MAEIITLNWNYISPYFLPHEIFSPDTIGHLHLVDIDALKGVNEVRYYREHCGKYQDPRLYINHAGHNLRGVISSRENMLRIKTWGGAPLSTHPQGHAFDVSPAYPHKREDLETLAEEMITVGGFTWVKVYPSWVHGDRRRNIQYIEKWGV